MKKCILFAAAALGMALLASGSALADVELVRAGCANCHGLDRLCAGLGLRDEAGWGQVVDMMVARGAPIPPDSRAAVAGALAALAPADVAECALAGGVVAGQALPPAWLGLVHPVLMLAACGPILVALITGWRRFSTAMLGNKALFDWRRHVLGGYLGLGLWAAGGLGGAAFTWLFFGGPDITGIHYDVGRAVVGLALAGGGLGIWMDRRKRRRKVLPLVHAGLNAAVVLLGVWQIVTGLGLLLGR